MGLQADAHFARQWLYQRLFKYAIHPLCRNLYVDRSRDISKSIMVVGGARSGTTWLANIVSSQFPSRLMFEPFNTKLMSDYSSFNYFQYMRPSDSNEALLAYCYKVLSGDIRHKWIDRQVSHILPKFRVIKDIRVNLFLKWFHDRFPSIPIVFILRHPCAVVLSRMRLGWATDSDILPMLSQERLVADFLADRMGAIESLASDEAKHAFIWCVNNLVPLTQFEPGQLHTVFYERLFTEPEAEFKKVFAAIDKPYDESALAYLHRPSRTAINTSAIMRGQEVVGNWKRHLSPLQIADVLSVVEAFGLGHIYGDSVAPLVTDLDLQPAVSRSVQRGAT